MSKIYDVIILGAGPAGLAAGLACAAGLFLAGQGLARRRVGRRRVRCAHEGIPLTRMI